MADDEVDVYRFEIRTLAGGEAASNVLHFRNHIANAQFPMEHMRNLVAIWEDDAMDAYLALMSEDAKVTSIRVKRINNGGGPTYTKQYDAKVGTRPGKVGTSGNSVVGLIPVLKNATWRVAKIYFPALSKLDFEDDRVKEELFNLVADFLSIIVGKELGGIAQFSYVVWDAVNKSYAETVEDQSSISPMIGMQKRRRIASP